MDMNITKTLWVKAYIKILCGKGNITVSQQWVVDEKKRYFDNLLDFRKVFIISLTLGVTLSRLNNRLAQNKLSHAEKPLPY